MTGKLTENWEKIQLCTKGLKDDSKSKGEEKILSDLKDFDFTNHRWFSSEHVNCKEDSLFNNIAKHFETEGNVFLFISMLKNEESSKRIFDTIKEKFDSFDWDKFLEKLTVYLSQIKQGEIRAKEFLKNDDFSEAFFTCEHSNEKLNANESLLINFTKCSLYLDTNTLFSNGTERMSIEKSKLERVILFDNGYKSVIIDKDSNKRNYYFTSDSSCQLIINRVIENKSYNIIIDITSGEVINIELKIDDSIEESRKLLNLTEDDEVFIKKQNLFYVLKKFLHEEEIEKECNDLLDECLPIKTLNDLKSWKPPTVKHYTAPLRKRMLDGNNMKTLVCHDMRNGYLEDRFINGIKAQDCFFFVHWSAIDMFTYFSHHLISIPPCGWISAAHRNGVQALGTFITEWDEGVEIFGNIFTDKTSVHHFCMQLVSIALYYNFDGWLINIENKLKAWQVPLLRQFVKSLTVEMHSFIPGSQVIWYDSVLKNGDLNWQSSLNDLNRVFFLNADGIFLNYNWKEKQLLQSVSEAAGRQTDVYCGIDVFGRGDCFTKGGFSTDICVREVRKYGLSAAIFAPGWVHECLELKDFKENQFKFWGQLQEIIPPRTIEGLPYCSSFCPGFGKKMSRNGKVISDEPWFNLSLQQPQPIYYPSKENSVSIYDDDAFNGGGCLCLSGDIINEETPLEFQILKTFFHLENTCVISYTFKSLVQNVDIALSLDMFSDQEPYKLYLVAPDSTNTGDASSFVRYLKPAPIDELIKIGYRVTGDSFEQLTWIKRTYLLSSIDFHYHIIRSISVRVSCVTSAAKSPVSVLLGELEIKPKYPTYNMTYKKLVCKYAFDNPQVIDVECTLDWQNHPSIFYSDLYIQSTNEEQRYICTTNQFSYNLKCSVSLTPEIKIILCPKSADSEYLPPASIKIPLKI